GGAPGLGGAYRRAARRGLRPARWLYRRRLLRGLDPNTRRLQAGGGSGGSMNETVVTDEVMREMRGKTKPYTLVLISPGPRWDTPDRDAIIWEHGRRNHALRLDKVLAIVGPVPDETPLVGLYIFDRAPEEAEQIMAGDPGVQAGVFVFE